MRLSPGSETRTFEVGPVDVEVALDAGPRIVGYTRRGGPDLFARVPGETIEHPDAGSFSLIGGHRLWCAPEIPEITYRPDDDPIVLEHAGNRISMTGFPDVDGVTKTVTLEQRGALTVVDHTLRNDGSRSVRCAAWAITQLVPGGTAILPTAVDPVDPDGVLPNRSIAVWPYTNLPDPDIALRYGEIRIRASRERTKAKIGLQNRRGWVAYTMGDEVFVKWAPLHRDDAGYVDLGSSVECYRDHRFIELETLGPVTDLEPGSELRHREVWTLTDLEGARLEDVLASLPSDPLPGGR